MRITQIQANYLTNPQPINNKKLATNTPITQQNETKYAQIPVTHKFGANIHFGEFFDPNRTVPHIDYEEYMAMSENTKKRFRKKYLNFFKNQNLDVKEMRDQRNLYMPLVNENLMDEFIKVSNNYAKYKKQPIICLGRSPKWFLNTALWTKNGIMDYKFVAFSRYWHKPDFTEGMIRMESKAPTAEEELAYRKYLKQIKADPQTIVNKMNKTGKKTVITDYIHTSRGFCSFLDIMARYAKDLGILEEFSKSIQLVNIASLEYLEELNPYAEGFSTPRVIMPEILKPYENNIKQEYYDMSAELLKNMLINQNTNECRSTYYPHETWTIYRPNRIKTGIIKDIDTAKGLVKKLKASHEKTLSSFTPAMYDYRNLLNFRILDALNARKLLKTIHKSKI